MIDLDYEAEAFTRNLLARRRSPNTVTTYLKAVNQLRDHLLDHGRNIAAVEVSRQDIEEFLVAAGGKMSATTLSQRFRSLQQFWKYVAAENDIANPMDGMTPPHAPITPPEVLTSDQLQRLFDTCAGTSFDDRRDAAILSLLADTGIRRGEISGIRLDDLDLTNQVVVVSGKTGTRGVPYGSQTATRLDRYLRVRRRHPAAAEPWLWLGRKGRLTVFGVEGVVQARGRQAGLDLNPHLFRHTFAHMWLDGGGNEGDLMRLAGWSSPQMLQRYGASAAGARARRAYLAGRSPVDRLTLARRSDA